MKEISLRVQIANREYPVKVRDTEEENVKLAARAINDKVRLFRNQFGIEDRQDLLAMVAFDCTIKNLDAVGIDENDEIKTRLEALNFQIEEILQKG